MRSRGLHALRLVDGAMAGAVGAASMMLTRPLIEQIRQPDLEQESEWEHVFRVRARRAGYRPSRTATRLIGSTLHLGYGAALGALFALTATRRRSRPFMSGVPYGLAVWYANYSKRGLIALMGALPPRRKTIPVAHHLVFGVVTAAVYAKLRARRRDLPLHDATVLITGGSRGLGLALARVFAKKGSRVALIARDATELDGAAAMLRPFAAELRTVVCDIRDPQQVASAVKNVETALGPIDVLINNAGVITVGPHEAMRKEDFAEAMNTHFWGPFNVIESVLPSMRRRGRGRIVNIASIGGKVSVPHLLPYSASKFALVGLSDGLRAELARDGIAVTTVCPGLMRTGSPPYAHIKGNRRAEYAWFSISDALPGLSMSVTRAARRIVAACEMGERELVLGLPAKIATQAHTLAPDLMGAALEFVARMLPKPTVGGESEQ